MSTVLAEKNASKTEYIYYVTPRLNEEQNQCKNRSYYIQLFDSATTMGP